jgi:hypothetical protein
VPEDHRGRGAGALRPAAGRGGRLHLDDLIDEYWMLRAGRAGRRFKQHCLPMAVADALRGRPERSGAEPRCGIWGSWTAGRDPVEVVYSPDFITPTRNQAVGHRVRPVRARVPPGALPVGL